MMFHSAQDPRLAEMGFRVVQNSAPQSVTATTAQIPIGAPVCLELSAASLPSSDGAVGQNFVTKANSVSSAATNNLLLGALARGAGSKSYLGPSEIGLAQCYGPMLNALVRREAAGVVAGTLLQPSDIGWVSPGTAGPIPGVAGMAILLDTLASSAASEITPARIFLRCM